MSEAIPYKSDRLPDSRAFPNHDVAVDTRAAVALQPLNSAPEHRLGEWAATAIWCVLDAASAKML